MRTAALLLTVIVSGCNYASFIESRVPTAPKPYVCEVRVIDKSTGREGCTTREDLERQIGL